MEETRRFLGVNGMKCKTFALSPLLPPHIKFIIIRQNNICRGLYFPAFSNLTQSRNVDGGNDKNGRSKGPCRLLAIHKQVWPRLTDANHRLPLSYLPPAVIGRSFNSASPPSIEGLDVTGFPKTLSKPRDLPSQRP